MIKNINEINFDYKFFNSLYKLNYKEDNTLSVIFLFKFTSKHRNDKKKFENINNILINLCKIEKGELVIKYFYSIMINIKDDNNFFDNFNLIFKDYSSNTKILQQIISNYDIFINPIQKYFIYKILLFTDSNNQTKFLINHNLDISPELYLNLLQSSKNPFNSFYIEKFFKNSDNNFQEEEIKNKMKEVLIYIIKYENVNNSSEDKSKYLELFKYLLWCISIYSLKIDECLTILDMLNKNIYDEEDVINIERLKSPFILHSLRIIAKNCYTSSI